MCEYDRRCENCVYRGLIISEEPCRKCYLEYDGQRPIKPNFTCKICKKESESMNKPLTISQLEQMNGQPVWIDCDMCMTKRWGIMNVEKNSIEWAGGGMHIIAEGNFYKEKPKPRMVTIEQAIEGKLLIRLNKTCLWDTGINSIISDVLNCDIKYRVKYLLEPVWEVKEG